MPDRFRLATPLSSGYLSYAFALLFQQAALNPFLAMFLAAGLSSVVCVPLGLILFRLRGAYFALSMLAFAEIARLIAQEWTSVTNGAAGLLYFSAFDKSTNYWVLLTMVIGSIVGTWLLVRSKPGAYFLAIREDQDAAEALGINTTRYKLLAFMVSAFMMGLAGAFYASYFAYLEPNVVFNSINFSLNVLIVTLIGGIGRLFGPVVGAAVLVLTTEIFVHVFGEGNVLMSGILLILVMLFMPEGLVGRLHKEIDRGRFAWQPPPFDAGEEGGLDGRKTGSCFASPVWASASAACRRWTMWTSRSATARWSDSSARTARARPRSSVLSAEPRSPRRGRSNSRASPSLGCARAGSHNSVLPEPFRSFALSPG